MPEFQVMPIEGTASEKAVSRILQRVANDRNYSWYMIGTESLRLCINAEAERTGKTEAVVEADLHAAIDAAQPRLKRHGADRPDVEVLRERIEKLTEKLEQLNDDGKIGDTEHEELLVYLEKHPSSWPSEPADQDAVPLKSLNEEGLSPKQLDGRACVVCGYEYGPMKPLPGRWSSTGSQLFHCTTCNPADADL